MYSVIVQDIPYQTNSENLFAAVRDMPDAIWLDSGKPRSLQGSFDIISACPDALVETRGSSSTIVENSKVRTSDEDPFKIAEQLLQPLLPVDHSIDAPFISGLMGYFGYDLGRQLVPIHDSTDPVDDLPDMRIGRFLWSLVINHQSRRSQLFFHQKCPESLRQELRDRFERVSDQDTSSASTFRLTQRFQPTTSPDQYRAAIGAIKDYINSGDCYQTNYTQHLSAPYEGDVWPAYLALREATAAPYSAFWQWEDQAILSLSPERFVKAAQEAPDTKMMVETKPIKGTKLRGATVDEDQENAISLINSSKDRAENLMIVDLLRNDLGKNCESGSIRVPELFSLESFPNVHHLVSTVTGYLDSDRSTLDLLRGCFPGGSITGAPKKRAMEIIEELEPVKRSVYCGSLAYISVNNRMDSNIAIRTMVADRGSIHCWGGGGIVADSEADDEFEESMNKIRLLLQTLEAL